MLKLNENEIYKEILNNFEINNINCELSINTKTNEFDIGSLYFFTNSNMVSINFYEYAITLNIIKRNSDENISEEFKKSTDIKVIIKRIKEIIEK